MIPSFDNVPINPDGPNMRDYEQVAGTYAIEIPEHFNYGFDVIDPWSADRSKLALVWADRTGRDIRKYSFFDLKHLSNRFANALMEKGFRKGDRLFVMVHDAAGKFDARAHLELTGRCGVTTLCAPPTAYRIFVLEDLAGYDFSGLRHCCSAGEPLNPEATAESFRGDWYYTGDKGYKDEEGYYWFVGRADDVINSSGYRIGPFEVESALQSHPAVAESAVVGSPDPSGARS